jgi:hypothetical protein
VLWRRELENKNIMKGKKLTERGENDVKEQTKINAWRIESKIRRGVILKSWGSHKEQSETKWDIGGRKKSAPCPGLRNTLMSVTRTGRAPLGAAWLYCALWDALKTQRTSPRSLSYHTEYLCCFIFECFCPRPPFLHISVSRNVSII